MINSIEKKAYDIGFDIIGFSHVIKEDEYLKRVLEKKEKMTLYPRKEEDINKYIDTEQYLNKCKTIISVGICYNTKRKPIVKNSITYSKSSFGEDYHLVLSKKIEQLISYLKSNIDGLEVYYSIDTSNLDDRYFAHLAGNGFYGKNSMIINNKYGSMVFYGTILLNHKLTFKQPLLIQDGCFECHKCESTCPTKSLNNYILNYQTCLSYLTQSKTLISSKLIKNNVYGCDICNDVCPYNTNYDNREYFEDEQYYDVKDFIALTNNDYNKLFKSKSLGWLNKNIIKKNAILSLNNIKRDKKSLIIERDELIKKKGSSLLIDAYNYILERSDENEL
ncbi:epoxyqueuosine reductase [Mycoplasma sp. P36-A1]|uniref:epoxyqueuosine reductase n=1 Tax=Mycoplasma sp. P36-A1 TaxID=3252900 RepID=UPI003C30D2FA